MWVRRAIVTTSKVHLLLPTLESSNRILRHFCRYKDHFLQVTFSDEHNEKLGPDLDEYEEILRDIEEKLTCGFYTANRHYRFLGFSSTQLREHTCWFFADTPDGIDVKYIREWMGDFSEIKSPARHAARMGQCFSNTRAVKTLQKGDMKEMPDIARNGYVLSDGVGKISWSLATEIASTYHRREVPGAFQFRLGGYKGVLAVASDNEMDGYSVHLRPSQNKFRSTHTELEIVRTAEFMPAYLNRQLIMLLVSMGIPEDVFVQIQDDYLQEVEGITSNERSALSILALHINGSWIVKTLRDMVLAGYLRFGDAMTKSMLKLFQIQVLRDTKERARIPVEQGAHLIGVLDETNTLKENQVVIRFTDPQDPSTIRSYVGPALVTRNPYLNPGDVHMVEAVDIPHLRSLVNCIVFSSQGERDLPSQCNGDLDGDTYMTIWDKRLLPSQRKFVSGYNKCEITAARKITIDDTIKFFIHYVVSDNVGAIANAHLAWADQSPYYTLSNKCVSLCQLHSKAVSFIKTGVPARLPFSLRPKLWPDFMNKNPRKSYISTNVLGKMYRSSAQKLNAALELYSTCTSEDARLDEKLLVPGYEAYIAEALNLKQEYDIMIRDIMNQHEIQTEAEVISGYIQKFSHIVSRKKEKFLLKESLGNVISAIWKTFHDKFNAEFADDTDNHKVSINRKRKASAWYYVSYNDPNLTASDPFMNDSSLTSFSWVVCDILQSIASDIE
ncbi:RdRP-domain-containing protein [Basidiobolus meristosporus CBS 931.73]|uniref:RNA-dependent RNA polymerase n=1 Tax=Basidiobolus meristosporus CBS 931.73 TaxID=1314790 RepID=A0A1Y1XYA1_9FUNG|nr:RdRP-domain-containing protein [Basidiobolus meristosporus CBS 931.73]|eukprot:ORX90712.1 RdRP-domain-containing protein [Basidiobolus meristosporus CBS 931.73]